MPAEMTDQQYAAHLSKRLLEVGNKMEQGDDRSLLFLCSGYLAGQRERINSLLKLLSDAKTMAEFGDINEDMEDDGIGWKQWYLDTQQELKRE